MRWVTKSQLHLDRVATTWLVRRFVDPAAEFVFLSWNDAAPDDDTVIVFGLPGIELSSHDERGTCFRKVLIRYRLEEPALELMERIIACGVAHAMQLQPSPGMNQDEQCLGTGLDLLGVGLGVAFDDAEHLDAGMAVYEAIYAYCQVSTLPSIVRADAPRLLPDRVSYLRAAIGRSVSTID